MLYVGKQHQVPPEKAAKPERCGKQGRNRGYTEKISVAEARVRRNNVFSAFVFIRFRSHDFFDSLKGSHKLVRAFIMPDISARKTLTNYNLQLISDIPHFVQSGILFVINCVKQILRA